MVSPKKYVAHSDIIVVYGKIYVKTKVIYFIRIIKMIFFKYIPNCKVFTKTLKIIGKIAI